MRRPVPSLVAAARKYHWPGGRPHGVALTPAAERPAALFTPRGSQVLSSLPNRTTQGGAGRIGRPGSHTLESHDLVRGYPVGVTAQTGVGCSQYAEVSRRSQSPRDRRARYSIVTCWRVSETVEVTGAGKPGVQVVSPDQ